MKLAEALAVAKKKTAMKKHREAAKKYRERKSEINGIGAECGSMFQNGRK